ncbi:MAG: AI-2E family transporter [Actinobacteria bacterium]|nr:AI-2E family transporter [Actinomycetota bacterium]
MVVEPSPDEPLGPDVAVAGPAEGSIDGPGRRRGAQYPAQPTENVSTIIRRAGSVAWAFVGLALAVAILIYVGARIAVVFPPLILAGMIVFLLNPFVTLLQRRGVPRAAGAGLAYLMFLGGVTLVIILAIPAIQDQASELADRWPEVQDRAEHWIDQRAEDLKGTPFEFNREDLAQRLTQDNEIDVGESLQRASEIGFQVLEVLLIFILAPIFAFYLLIDLPHLRKVAEELIPPNTREDVHLVARRLNHALGGFFRGQLVVALIVGIMSSVGLWIIDLPFWLLIGMIAGFFNLIPLIGPYIGGVPAVLIALTTSHPTTAIWAALVLLIVQQIDNHFISPLVMKRAVKLHPVVVMIVLLLGGSLFGFFGLLVAVPATAAVKIIGSHLWRVRVLGHTPEEWYEESEASDSVPAVGVVEDVPVGEPGSARLPWHRRPSEGDRPPSS